MVWGARADVEALSSAAEGSKRGRDGKRHEGRWSSVHGWRVSPVLEVEEGGGGGQAALQDGLMARSAAVVTFVKAAAITMGVIEIITWAAPVP